MMEQKFDAELNALQKMVDARKEALDIEKDIYDYHNQIAEKTKSITNLQKQLAAYSGDSSQEGQSRLQKIQYELSEAQKDLEETEYERYISDQKDMLDKLLKEFEEGIEKQLQDFEDTVKTALENANINSTNILTTLKEVAAKNNYTIQYDESQSATLEEFVDNIIDAIHNPNDINTDNKDNSNTEPATTVPEPETNTNHVEETIKNTNDLIAGARVEDINREKKAQVEAIFGNDKYYKKSTKKKASDYNTSINQFLFKKNKKALTSEGLKQLREILGVKNSGILDALKALSKKTGNIKNVGGFATGGIGKLIKDKGEDGIAFVRNGEGFVAPEDVPVIKDLLDTVPALNNMLQPLVNIPKLPNDAILNKNGNNTVNIQALTLPNVTNYEEFRSAIFNEMKTSKQFEGMVQDMSIKRINGGSSLAKNRYKF